MLSLIIDDDYKIKKIITDNSQIKIIEDRGNFICRYVLTFTE
jgi:hypothetical protein